VVKAKRPKFNTRWDRLPDGDVEQYSTSKTETAYIPHEVQIKRMHEASLNYALWKREQFDFGPDDDVDDDFNDPTRSPGYGRLDAEAYIIDLNRRIAEKEAMLNNEEPPEEPDVTEVTPEEPEVPVEDPT